MNKLISYLRNKSYFNLLLKAQSLWVLFITLPLCFNFEGIFGTNKIVIKEHFLFHPYSISFFLIQNDSNFMEVIALFLTIAIAVYHLFRPFNISLLILMAFLFLNIEMYIFASSNSGWTILKNIWVYLILAYLLEKLSNKFNRDSFLLPMARYQLVVIYTMSSLHKLKGTTWLSGDALKLALSNPEYSNIADISYLIPDSILSLTNWFVLFFQLSFVFTLFLPRVNVVYIAIGLVTHTIILFSFGLSTFWLGMTLLFFSFLYRRDFPLYKLSPLNKTPQETAATT